MAVRRAVFSGLVATGAVVSWASISDDEYALALRNRLDSVPILHDAWAWSRVQLDEMSSSFTKPVRDSLLPSWPLPMMPPETPQPMTVVIDLEDTLVKSTWDRRYGWRHAKRPGADEFLLTLARNGLEVVIFSSNIFGIADPVVSLLDTKGCVMHRLYRDACWFKEGKYIKDLSKLNRDERRIIIIDDDPDAYSMQPDNAIPIRKFVDPTDKSDTELREHLPFIDALVIEDARAKQQGRVADVRATLRTYRNASKLQGGKSYAAIYNHLRLSRMSQHEEKKTKGLGGWARGGQPRGMQMASKGLQDAAKRI